MTTEQTVVNRLLCNNKYDKEWIEQAVWYIVNNVATETFLANFNAEQLKTAKRVIESPYGQLILSPKFNNSQMQVIASAIERGLSNDAILVIAKAHIPYQCMDYIAQGFLEGLDFSTIEKYDELDPNQCYEILEGYRTGVHYRAYAYAEIPACIMSMIRVALDNGYTARYNVKKDELVVSATNIISDDESITDNKSDEE